MSRRAPAQHLRTGRVKGNAVKCGAAVSHGRRDPRFQPRQMENPTAEENLVDLAIRIADGVPLEEGPTEAGARVGGACECGGIAVRGPELAARQRDYGTPRTER